MAPEPVGTTSGTALADERTIPADREPTTEELVLAQCLYATADELCEIRGLLSPRFFTTPKNRTIFRAMCRVLDRGELVDQALLAFELEREGRLEEVGGRAWLALLGSADNPAYDGVALARQLHADETRRRIVRAAREGATFEEIAQGVVDVLHDTETGVRSGIEFLKDAEVEEMPRPRWIYPKTKTLQVGALSMIVGPGGAGKSFLGIDICQSIQTGLESVLGTPLFTGQCFYIGTEGALGPRLTAWRMKHGVTDPTGLRLSTKAVQLAQPREVDRLIRSIRSVTNEPRLVVVDTVARTHVGYSENKGEDVSPYIEGCDRIRSETGAGVALLHHMDAAATKARGHSSWRDSVDMLAFLKQEGESLRKLTCDKQRDAEPFDPIHLELAIFGPSAVLVRTDTRDAIDRRDAPEYIRSTLRVLHKSIADGEGLATSKWEKIAAEEKGLSSSTFYRHRKMLIEGRFVEPEDVAGGTRNHVTEKGRDWLR